MGRSFFRELRAAGRSFAALAALLLALPVLMSTLPRPALANAMAEISGYSICSTIADVSKPSPVKPTAPCDNCTAGTGCAAVAIADHHALLALLLPQRRLAGALEAAAPLPVSGSFASVHPARGPPALS